MDGSTSVLASAVSVFQEKSRADTRGIPQGFQFGTAQTILQATSVFPVLIGRGKESDNKERRGLGPEGVSCLACDIQYPVRRDQDRARRTFPENEQ